MIRAITFFLPFVIQFGIAQSITWEPTNGPFGGRIRGISHNALGHLFVTAWCDGVYRSTDLGHSWVPLDPGFTGCVYSVAADSSGYVYVGSEFFGLFRSTDNGNSWSQLAELDVNQVLSIVVRPNGELYISGRNDGIFRSTDHGDSWTPVSADTSVDASTIAVDNFGNVYAGSYGIFRSSDMGITWERVDGGIINDYIYSIAIYGEEMFAATSDGLYKSTDSGNSWSTLTTGLSDSVFFDIDRDANGTTVVGSESGVYSSSDGGSTWLLNTSGLSNHYVMSIDVTLSTTIVAGTHGTGVYVSSNSGLDWSWESDGLPSPPIRGFVFDGNGKVHAIGYQNSGSSFGYIYRSEDSGESWLRTGLSDPMEWVTSICLELDGSLLVGSGQGVWKSSDNGNTWFQLGLDSAFVYSLIVSPEGFIIAGTSGYGIYRSTDNGFTWHNSLTDESVKSLTVGHDGSLYAGTSGDVFRSSDAGDSWVQIGGPMNTFVNAISANSSGHVFAGDYDGLFRTTDGGFSWTQLIVGTIYFITIDEEDDLLAGSYFIFYSEDNGESWIDGGVGLPRFEAIYAVAIAPDGRAFAGTEKEGIFVTSQPVTTIKATWEAPLAFDLEQNYPNPFNSNTTISFSVPRSGQVTLKIFNLLGEEVATLVSGNRDAGTFTVEWNADGQPSGVYFYRLKAGDFIQTRKLVLLR